MLHCKNVVQCASISAKSHSAVNSAEIVILLEIKLSHLNIDECENSSNELSLSLADSRHQSDSFSIQFASKFEREYFKAMLEKAREESSLKSLRESQALAAVVKKGNTALKRRQNKFSDL